MQNLTLEYLNFLFILLLNLLLEIISLLNRLLDVHVLFHYFDEWRLTHFKVKHDGKSWDLLSTLRVNSLLVLGWAILSVHSCWATNVWALRSLFAFSEIDASLSHLLGIWACCCCLWIELWIHVCLLLWLLVPLTIGVVSCWAQITHSTSNLLDLIWFSIFLRWSHLLTNIWLRSIF